MADTPAGKRPVTPWSKATDPECDGYTSRHPADAGRLARPDPVIPGNQVSFGRPDGVTTDDVTLEEDSSSMVNRYVSLSTGELGDQGGHVALPTPGSRRIWPSPIPSHAIFSANPPAPEGGKWENDVHVATSQRPVRDN